MLAYLLPKCQSWFSCLVCVCVGEPVGQRLFFFFFDIGFLCVALAVLKLRNLPASVPQVGGLKACATTAQLELGS